MTDQQPTSDKQQQLDDIDFETAMDELNKIVAELEDGQLGLSGSLQRYEEGVVYLKHCCQLLERAEQRIALLTGVDADGNPISQAYDEQEMGLEEKAQARSQRRSVSKRGPSKSDTSNVDVPGGLF